MAKRVFISKNENETAQLKYLLEERNLELISHSFLEFRQVDFDVNPSTEIIFFGSPRAVEFFTNKVTIASTVKIASVGSKTTQSLEQLGYTVDFSGNSSDSTIVAQEFKAWAGNRTILFPLSDISLKTIVSQFEARQIKELVVYETIIKHEVIESCDVYVFTSPSNLRGFLELNSVPKNSIIIAWGRSTANELDKLNIQVDHVLNSPSMLNLTEVLLN